jgi:hypothetical protein
MNKRIFSKIFDVVCIKLEHQVTRKAGYITNRIYTLGTRDFYIIKFCLKTLGGYGYGGYRHFQRHVS